MDRTRAPSCATRAMSCPRSLSSVTPIRRPELAQRGPRVPPCAGGPVQGVPDQRQRPPGADLRRRRQRLRRRRPRGHLQRHQIQVDTQGVPELRPPPGRLRPGFQVGQEEQRGGQQHRHDQRRTGRQRGTDRGRHHHQQQQREQQPPAGEQHLPASSPARRLRPVNARSCRRLVFVDPAQGQLPGHPRPDRDRQARGRGRQRVLTRSPAPQQILECGRRRTGPAPPAAPAAAGPGAAPAGRSPRRTGRRGRSPRSPVHPGSVQHPGASTGSGCCPGRARNGATGCCADSFRIHRNAAPKMPTTTARATCPAGVP